MLADGSSFHPVQDTYTRTHTHKNLYIFPKLPSSSPPQHSLTHTKSLLLCFRFFFFLFYLVLSLSSLYLSSSKLGDVRYAVSLLQTMDVHEVPFLAATASHLSILMTMLMMISVSQRAREAETAPTTMMKKRQKRECDYKTSRLE